MTRETKAGASARPEMATSRVRLCAIARDEGAYLADWIFHHLYFGFDSIEIWVNGTSDTSIEILTRTQRHHPEVRYEVVDELLAQCVSEGRVFQHEAYERMARRARHDGFSHAAFLDLDEWWLARDFRTPIQDFLGRSGRRPSVVSFPWLMDVPDRNREPFRHAVLDAGAFQLDSHVKSVMSLDDRLGAISVHTARARGGRRLIRERFPREDGARQLGWSVVSSAWLASNSAAVPEAFVLHAAHRSQEEYVSGLAKGLRQTGRDISFKNTRGGFSPSVQPRLTWEVDARDSARYRERLDEFRRNADVNELTTAAELQSTRRYEAAMHRLRTEPDFLRAHVEALHGICDEGLDRAFPGWDVALNSWVDSAAIVGDRLEVTGWAFRDDRQGGIEFAIEAGPIETGQGVALAPLSCVSQSRPEVGNLFKGAPDECGFRLEFPALAAPLVLLMRLEGRTHWRRTPLSPLLSGEGGESL
ncbi:MAG: glycosyltransferase family 2 protein [Nocardioides sp.]|jgi:hypothetical protein